MFEHVELHVQINFYRCSVVNEPLHSFLRILLHIEVFKIYFPGARTWSPKVEQGVTVLEQDA
jgi:hypothetical protein